MHRLRWMFAVTHNDINAAKSISVYHTSKILLLHYWLITWTLNLVENDLNGSSTLSIYSRISFLSKWRDWKVFFTWAVKILFCSVALGSTMYGTIVIVHINKIIGNDNEEDFRYFIYIWKIHFAVTNNNLPVSSILLKQYTLMKFKTF